jgi:hypothetical protein
MVARTVLPAGNTRPTVTGYFITNSIDTGPVRAAPTLAGMTEVPPRQRVEVTFVGAPPAARVARASGVSQVEVDGSVLRCVVYGSFQPFLEALRGYEVTSLQSSPTHD